MDTLEISARTVEEATKKALTQLNVGLDQIEITVLSEGKSGILGIGSEDAKIRVKIREPEIDEDTAAIEEARGILQELLNKMGFQPDISIERPEAEAGNEDEDSPVMFNVSGESMDILIGRRGQTIDAIQYLVRLMLSRKTRSKIPIMIDVEDYKKRRYDDLRILALNVADQVKSRKTSCRLEPMTAYERRIVHMTLANDPDVTTESIGEGESRKVVVYPKNRK